MANIVEFLGLFVLGGLLWTLFEYFVHGILSHRYHTPVTPMHWGHHQQLEHVFTPPIAWLPVSLLISSLFVFIFGWFAGSSLSVGMLCGFAYYEYCHWRIHFRPPASARQTLLRDHHLAHHFRNPKAYFGVSVIFWDKVFGSRPDCFAEDYRIAGQRHPLGKNSDQ